MAIPEQVVTQVTVQEVAQIKNTDGTLGAKLTCSVPLLEGPRKMPLTIWGCLAAQAPPPGTTMTAMLTRGKQSDKYDGSAYWHYQWRWGGPAPAQPAPAKDATTTKAPSEAAAGPAPGPRTAEDRKNRSVEAQVSAYCRKDLAIACLQQAVLYFGSVPGVEAKKLAWADVIQAARLAYEEFCPAMQVAPTATEPEPGQADY